jgi:hypothetical protein
MLDERLALGPMYCLYVLENLQFILILRRLLLLFLLLKVFLWKKIDIYKKKEDLAILNTTHKNIDRNVESMAAFILVIYFLNIFELGI